MGALATQSACRARPRSDHATALTGRFASRQHQTAGTPGETRRGVSGASRRVLQTGCRVLKLRRNHGQPVRMEDTS